MNIPCCSRRRSLGRTADWAWICFSETTEVGIGTLVSTFSDLVPVTTTSGIRTGFSVKMTSRDNTSPALSSKVLVTASYPRLVMTSVYVPGGTSPIKKEPDSELTSPLDTSLTRTFACITRSEEHTSELQSRLHLVCRLLLEKKKK